jgi:hypothetical protein
MLATLESQLHFVREIQAVNTTGIEPLQSIRDETEEGMQELTIGLDDLKDALAEETIVGRNRRPRRRRVEEVEGMKQNEHEKWDVLGLAERKIGRYFVVDSTGVDRGNGSSGAS